MNTTAAALLISLKRYGVILVAYFLTVLVAAFGAILVIGGTSTLSIFGLAVILIGILSFVPSTVTILLAESFRIRSVWYYLAIAVTTGAILSRIIEPAWWMSLRGAIVGVFSGSLFWAVAGRHAGILKAPPTAQAQKQLLLLLGGSALVVAGLMLFHMR
jgi:hypothetical protein